MILPVEVNTELSSIKVNVETNFCMKFDECKKQVVEDRQFSDFSVEILSSIILLRISRLV